MSSINEGIGRLGRGIENLIGHTHPQSQITCTAVLQPSNVNRCAVNCWFPPSRWLISRTASVRLGNREGLTKAKVPVIEMDVRDLSTAPVLGEHATLASAALREDVDVLRASGLGDLVMNGGHLLARTSRGDIDNQVPHLSVEVGRIDIILFVQAIRAFAAPGVLVG